MAATKRNTNRNTGNGGSNLQQQAALPQGFIEGMQEYGMHLQNAAQAWKTMQKALPGTRSRTAAKRTSRGSTKSLQGT